MNDLEKVVAEARKHGMSYGKYVDMLKQEEQMTQELKELIITDYESGLSANEIAEKYKINPTTTRNNIWNWREKGLIKSVTEVEPKKQVENNEPIPAPVDNIDMSATEKLEKLQRFVRVFVRVFGDAKIDGVFADNTENVCDVRFVLSGKRYIVQMKEVRDVYVGVATGQARHQSLDTTLSIVASVTVLRLGKHYRAVLTADMMLRTSKRSKKRAPAREQNKNLSRPV